MNKALIISLLFLVLVGVGVSRLKYEVVFLRGSLKNIQTAIEKSSDELKVFGAEWSYLNDPKRLKKLCEKYISDMKPLENSKIVSYNKFIKTEYESPKSEKADAFSAFLDKTLVSEKGRG